MKLQHPSGIGRMPCLRAWLALLAAMLVAPTLAAGAAPPEPPERVIRADYTQVAGPRSTMWREAIGAARAAEGLRADWQAHLKMVQDEIGFRSLRFHGIFHDEMGVYTEDRAGNPVYNWQYVDALYDAMLERGIRPFVEIGFMPTALASQKDKTIFWWRGNASLPKDWGRWQDFVTAFVNHLTERYGREEVLQWHFEIWNEPDVPPFLAVPAGADRKATYFELYARTARAVKRADPAYKVGGPSVNQPKDWIPELIAYCVANQVPLDFITFHSYGLAGLDGGLDPVGDKRYFIHADPLGQAHAIAVKGPGVMANSALPRLPIHVTEWNTSWAKHDHVHDSYYNAAITLGQLKKIEQLAPPGAIASVARWTFSDIFEEDGIPPTPFWGGFGIVNLQGIKKAAFFAFKYLNALGATELTNTDAQSWVTRDDRGGVQALFFDLRYPMKEALKQSNNEFFGKMHPPLSEQPATLSLKQLPAGDYEMHVHRTGFKKNDAYSHYLEMGSPRHLSRAQVTALKALAADQPERVERVRVGSDGSFERRFVLRSNDIVLVTLTRRQP